MGYSHCFDMLYVQTEIHGPEIFKALPKKIRDVDPEFLARQEERNKYLETAGLLGLEARRWEKFCQRKRAACGIVLVTQIHGSVQMA